MLLSINDVSAAVYATAISAKRDPADALTANNLGAALKAARAYRSAFAVLLYADARQPESAVILTNLGNVALALGHGESAGRFYEAALKAAPDHPAALTGLGSLALCRGDEATAARHFRKALSEMYLPAARAGLAEARSAGGAGASPAGPGQPSPSPASGDAPVEHPAGKGGGQGLVVPQPPVTGSARATAQGAERLQDLVADAERQLSDLGERAEALRASMAASGGSSGGGLTALNSYEKEQSVLDNLARIFDDRVTRTLEPLPEAATVMVEAQQKDNDIYEKGIKAELACGDNDRCARAVRLKMCLDRHQNAERSHGEFLRTWQKIWPDASRALTDYYAFSTPWLQDVHDPTANQLYNIARESYVISQATALYSLGQGEAEQLAGFMEEDCGQLALPPVVPDTRPLKAYPGDPTKCRSGSLYISVAFATVEGDCDALKLEFAAGVFVSGKYKWGTASSNDQVTLWGGLGASAGAGKVGVSGKIGPYVTYDLGDAGAKMVDYGVKDQAGIKADLGLISVGASAEARFSAETGVKVDYSGPKIGSKIGRDTEP